MIPTKSRLSRDAHISSMEAYRAEYERSLSDPEGFWAEQAQSLTWFQQPSAVRSGGFEALDMQWFPGGRLNACWNCVDRHLADRGEKTAIIWAGDEAGEYRHISYRELHQEVCRIANVLQAEGVRKGDRVCIYLPMI
ncbi:MAG: acetyl-coenzyme A synthetase N-terminal domain-containing protein, partial [Myxococcota bacterium]|nr:acetyl-coenzyme A synthetase N-terminal domain-containing protein [Myxococcota bacterium]